MQKLESSGNKKLSKQEYSRLYSMNNKNRWKSADKKAHHPFSNVFQLFKRSVHSSRPPTIPLSAPYRARVLKGIELLILLVMVAIISFFLIREAAVFYLDAQESPFQFKKN